MEYVLAEDLVLGFLTARELVCISLVCKRTRNEVANDSFWKALLQRDFINIELHNYPRCCLIQRRNAISSERWTEMANADENEKREIEILMHLTWLELYRSCFERRKAWQRLYQTFKVKRTHLQQLRDTLHMEANDQNESYLTRAMSIFHFPLRDRQQELRSQIHSSSEYLKELHKELRMEFQSFRKCINHVKTFMDRDGSETNVSSR